MKKTILITNDDGMFAPGIQYLHSFIKDMGEIFIVAPDTGMSGMGHAVTIKTPLRINELPDLDGAKRYTTNGTPVDCVKLAISQILKKKPDVIVSGINHGSNHSVNVLYSGTMAAAIEGAMHNIPSIGFSMCNHDDSIDLSFMKEYVRKICQVVFENGLPSGVCLNVNFPNTQNPVGIKVCTQSMGLWDGEFDSRLDVRNQHYYWLKGELKVDNSSDKSDGAALKNGFISIVPTTIDLTAFNAMSKLEKLIL